MLPTDKDSLLRAELPNREPLDPGEPKKARSPRNRSRAGAAVVGIGASFRELGDSLGMTKKPVILEDTPTPHPELGRIEEDPTNIRVLDAPTHQEAQETPEDFSNSPS